MSGMEIKIECPECDGSGEKTIVYESFDTEENRWKKSKVNLYCSFCEGTGKVLAIADDEITIDIEPRYNEGMI